MATIPYLCEAQPLASDGFAHALSVLGVDAAMLWTLVAVETQGCGYLQDRRPKILFERKHFHDHTGGQYDATNPDISNPQWGGYGAGGAAQYGRLAEAYALNPEAALMSASWGLGQVMGDNFSLAGYTSVDDMVQKCCASEDEHLLAMANFIVHNNLATALQQQDWQTYAAGYNGPQYAANHYDTRLAQSYAGFKSGAAVPSLDVRTAQMYLTFLGYDPHGVDGVAGNLTLTALHRFQSDKGMALTPAIDDDVVAALDEAMHEAVDLSLSA